MKRLWMAVFLGCAAGPSLAQAVATPNDAPIVNLGVQVDMLVVGEEAGLVRVRELPRAVR